MEWGELGDGPGQCDLVHGLAVDGDRRVYVGDRSNNRIQIFTENGEFIEEWPDISDPVGVFVDATDGVWVISATLNRLLKDNRDGELPVLPGGRTEGPGAALRVACHVRTSSTWTRRATSMWPAGTVDG